MKLIVFSICALLLSACADTRDAQSSARATSIVDVRTTPVLSRAFHETLSASGIIVAEHSTVLGAAVGGRVVSMPIHDGEMVHRGDLIARLDTETSQSLIDERSAGAQAAIASSQAAAAAVLAAQARLQLARTTATRTEDLYSGGAVPRQQNDEAQAALSAASADLERAKAQLRSASAAVGQAKAAQAAAGIPLADATLRVPFDGIVLSRAVDVGSVVTPGSQVATIESLADLQAEVTVPESAIAALVPGTLLSVTVDAFHAQNLHARVLSSLPARDPQSHMLAVRLALSAPPGALPGMFVRAEIPYDTRSEIVIPFHALVTREHQDGVFTVESGVAHFLPVHAGAMHDGLVAIEDAPASLHRVITTGIERVTDGARVRVTTHA